MKTLILMLAATIFYMWVPIAMLLTLLGFIADYRYFQPASLMLIASTWALWLAWLGARNTGRRRNDEHPIDWTQN